MSTIIHFHMLFCYRKKQNTIWTQDIQRHQTWLAVSTIVWIILIYVKLGATQPFKYCILQSFLWEKYQNKPRENKTKICPWSIVFVLSYEMYFIQHISQLRCVSYLFSHNILSVSITFRISIFLNYITEFSYSRSQFLTSSTDLIVHPGW